MSNNISGVSFSSTSLQARLERLKNNDTASLQFLRSQTPQVQFGRWGTQDANFTKGGSWA